MKANSLIQTGLLTLTAAFGCAHMPQKPEKGTYTVQLCDSYNGQTTECHSRTEMLYEPQLAMMNKTSTVLAGDCVSGTGTLPSTDISRPSKTSLQIRDGGISLLVGDSGMVHTYNGEKWAPVADASCKLEKLTVTRAFNPETRTLLITADHQGADVTVFCQESGKYGPPPPPQTGRFARVMNGTMLVYGKDAAPGLTVNSLATASSMRCNAK